MDPLAASIRAEIAARGPVSFERFMELALYHPRYGYYAAADGRPRTGRAGDFITSVSVGPLFGRLLARQFFQMWELLGRPDPFWIVEQGAHDGRLAGDILGWMREEAPPLFAAARYGLVESFPAAAQRQREGLARAGLAGKAAWFPEVEALAGALPGGVFFSNELVDAFPVRAVVFRGGAWRERLVAWDGERFTWAEGPLGDQALARAVAGRPLPEVEGHVAEIGLRAESWMRRLGTAWPRGYVVTIDYGHRAADLYAPFRSSGTLAAYRGHRRADDPLADPGRQDLTTHVDFTALARAGAAAGLACLGWTDQHHFLTGIAAPEMEGAPGPRAGVASAARAWLTLVHPDHFGTRFHALVQAKGVVPAAIDGLRFARPFAEANAALGGLPSTS